MVVVSDSVVRKIVSEVNQGVSRKRSLKLDSKDFEKALLSQNTTIELKKKRLIGCLHTILVTTFAIKPSQINMKTIEHIKARLTLAREIIHKIQALNNYIEEFVLHELGVIKKPSLLVALKKDKPEAYLKKNRQTVTKKDLAVIESRVYQLMEEIIIFDRTLLRKYSKDSLKETQAEKLELKDLKALINKQTHCLEMLEAKLPPAAKITKKLFQKSVYQEWAPRVLALLSTLEIEQRKEQIIFKKIKLKSSIRKKIDHKIKHIIDEKQRVLKLKEKRALAMDSLPAIQEDYRHTFHQYVSASHL